MVKSKIKKIGLMPFLVLILSIPSVIALMHKGFFPTHDFIYVARISEMFKALGDGQFPVRWVAGFRYGDPTFNFYAPLPYYLGTLVHALGLGFLDTSKVLFGTSFILSSLAMYLLGKELFGKWGGFIASMLYLYAPYRSIDVYVRGTLNEAWAFVFFPLIFLYFIKLAKKPLPSYIAFLSISLAGLFFTHNVMTVLFIPFFGLFILYSIIASKFDKRLIINTILSAALGIGLASTFLLPAFLEKKFVQTSYLTAGYFDFAGHFVAVRQWFNSPWGYGASLWGPVDDMSFQVGVIQWILIAFTVVLWGYKKIIKKSRGENTLVPVLIILFVGSLFLQHNLSTFLWKTFPILAYTQFPWRFLAISVFFAAIIGAYVISKIKNPKTAYLLVFIILASLLFINIKYFKPKEYYLDSIDAHYMGNAVLSKDDKIPKDYLPIWVKVIKADRIGDPNVTSGVISTSDYEVNSRSAGFTAKAEKSGKIEIPVTYFPGWQAYIDGKRVDINDPSERGLIVVDIPEGDHSVNLRLGNTPIRTIGDMLTIISLFVILFLFQKKYKFLSPLLK